MRPLKYSINVTLDGCCDHRAGIPSEELHRHHAQNLAAADAIILGRVTYEMMEEAWRPEGGRPEWMEPFARTMSAAKKYVVSSKRDHVEWNSELLRGDLGDSIRKLKQQPGGTLLTGGVTLPTALAELDLIDEYELVVHPRIAGHGPTLLSGLTKMIDLKFAGRKELGSDTVVMRYEVRR